jgi:hypothetical protein
MPYETVETIRFEIVPATPPRQEESQPHVVSTPTIFPRPDTTDIDEWERNHEWDLAASAWERLQPLHEDHRQRWAAAERHRGNPCKGLQILHQSTPEEPCVILQQANLRTSNLPQ